MGRGLTTSCTFIKRSMSRNLPDSLLIETIRNRNWEFLDRRVAERAKIVDTILKYTEITNDHMTPDLKLFLLTPRCSLYRDPFDRVNKEFDQVEKRTWTNPFWSIYWPGGQGLVKFIFQEQKNIFMRSKDINVLDLGTGCGATAIATKLLGIRNVVANDIDEGSSNYLFDIFINICMREIRIISAMSSWIESSLFAHRVKTSW